uniref:Uncharacterized protein n=1 Tax=Peronospora matthiolae TaxID=2874970 RepID=A0AAV1U1N6_9STRA
MLTACPVQEAPTLFEGSGSDLQKQSTLYDFDASSSRDEALSLPVGDVSAP